MARRLFHAQGYGATGLAQILGEAGVNSGSLYHFFRSKEDLLVAILEAYRDNIGEWLLEPVYRAESDPIERVFRLLDVYRDLILESSFRYGCPIGNLALELDEFQPRPLDLVCENFDGWREAVRGCLDAAGDRLADDVDRDALATFILTTMEGAVMLARLPQHRAVRQRRRPAPTAHRPARPTERGTTRTGDTTLKLKPLLALAALTSTLAAAETKPIEPAAAATAEASPMAPFARLVGGAWSIGPLRHEFSWGIENRTLLARTYGPDGLLSSEARWFFHPGENAIKGYSVDRNGQFFAEMTTRFDGDRMINDLVTVGADGERSSFTGEWVFTDSDHYDWTLFAVTPDGKQKQMSMTATRQR